MQWRGDIDYEQGMYKSRAMKSQAKANLVGGIVGAMGTLYGGMSGGAGAGAGASGGSTPLASHSMSNIGYYGHT
jgi:hypothetical protein